MVDLKEVEAFIDDVCDKALAEHAMPGYFDEQAVAIARATAKAQLVSINDVLDKVSRGQRIDTLQSRADYDKANSQSD